MPRKPSRKSLVKKLDDIFSKYVRMVNADPHTGLNSCYTCGLVKHWKELQCGHFQTRGHYMTRWNPDNCRPQCGRCNMLSGEQYRFGLELDREFYSGKAEELEILAHKTAKFSDAELLEMIEHFDQEVDKL